MKVLGTAQMAKVNQGDNLITEGEIGDVMYVVVKAKSTSSKAKMF